MSNPIKDAKDLQEYARHLKTVLALKLATDLVRETNEEKILEALELYGFASALHSTAVTAEYIAMHPPSGLDDVQALFATKVVVLKDRATAAFNSYLAQKSQQRPLDG